MKKLLLLSVLCGGFVLANEVPSMPPSQERPTCGYSFWVLDGDRQYEILRYMTVDDARRLFNGYVGYSNSDSPERLIIVPSRCPVRKIESPKIPA